jgi:hypothetical protein
MNGKLRWLLVAAVVSLTGCVYEAVVVQGSTVQQRFDRAWSAASGAMYDQGLTITVQDRAAGILRGERGGAAITATFQTSPDGSIQVKFSSSGTAGTDPTLIDRVSSSYDRRMGM